jgi:hypothetical protein
VAAAARVGAARVDDAVDAAVRLDRLHERVVGPAELRQSLLQHHVLAQTRHLWEAGDDALYGLLIDLRLAAIGELLGLPALQLQHAGDVIPALRVELDELDLGRRVALEALLQAGLGQAVLVVLRVAVLEEAWHLLDPLVTPVAFGWHSGAEGQTGPSSGLG